MELRIIECDDSIFTDIINLGKKNAKTLGMFPEGAFIEHAKKKCIIAAIEKGVLLGYILFRITRSKGIISITHLCVNPEFRKKGVAKLLLNFVKNKYQNLFRGISLSCRKDFIEASRFYEKNGFKAVKEIRSRSKAERYLVKWFYDFGNQDLFSSIHISNSKFNVLLDANIIIKLRDLNEDESNEIETLNADWLEDEVDYFYAQEMLNEINRDVDKNRAAKTRSFIGKFKEVRFFPEERDQILNGLSDLMTGQKINDLSDKIQIAECIASQINAFVTIDKNILSFSDIIFELYSVKILTPSELILYIDQLRNTQNYESVRLAGANYVTKSVEATDINSLCDLFISKEFDEKKHELNNKINFVIGKIKQSYIKVVKDKNDIGIGFVAGTFNENTFTINVIRTKNNKIATILFYQLVTNIVNFAVEANLNKIIIDDKYLNENQKEILSNFEFEKSEGYYYKISLKGIIKSSEIFENELLANSEINLSKFNERISTLTYDESELLKFGLERKYWPIKFEDLDIPTYIVPIKKYWASQLFDFYQADQTLFGAKAELMWQRQNIYYRNVMPVSEKYPARILWYVSSEAKITTGRQKGIVACSYLDEVIIGSAKNLFQKFKNFGIYEWKDIYNLAEQDSNKEIKALRFSDTEVFKKVISFSEIVKIFEENDRLKNTFTSPVLVSKDIFNKVYEIGKEL